MLAAFSINENEVEVAFKGDKAALKAQGIWMTTEDLAGITEMAWVSRRLKAMRGPVAEAGELADKAKELKKDADGAFAGTLDEDTAKELLGRYSRRGAVNAKDVKGAVKFWTKAGVLSNYEVSIQGTLLGRDDKETAFTRAATVEVKDVGKTKLDVPDDVKKKLS